MPSNKLRIPQFHYKCNYYIANMKFSAKNFAIIIIFLGNDAFRSKEKRRKSLICSVLLILTFGSSGATNKKNR